MKIFLRCSRNYFSFASLFSIVELTFDAIPSILKVSLSSVYSISFSFSSAPTFETSFPSAQTLLGFLSKTLWAFSYMRLGCWDCSEVIWDLRSVLGIFMILYYRVSSITSAFLTKSWIALSIFICRIRSISSYLILNFSSSYFKRTN